MMIGYGTGIARVHATGPGTEIGKIGKMLGGIEDETTLLQQQTRKVIRTFSVIGLSMCLILTVIYGLVREQWLDGILAGLSLAMAILPEEFAVVLTIFMAIGAYYCIQHCSASPYHKFTDRCWRGFSQD